MFELYRNYQDDPDNALAKARVGADPLEMRHRASQHHQGVITTVMRCYANQLPLQLQKGLAPFYLVFGEEPFQQGQCVSAIRQTASNKGLMRSSSLLSCQASIGKN